MVLANWGRSLFCLLCVPSALFAQAPPEQGAVSRLGIPAALTASEQGGGAQRALGGPVETPNTTQPSEARETADPGTAKQAVSYSALQLAAPPIGASSAVLNRSSAPPLPADSFGSGKTDNASTCWFTAEYVSWWVRGSNLPPMVTSSSTGTPLASAGVLGTPGVAVLLGNDQVNDEMRPGGRFGFGVWFNDKHTCGLEAGVMFIGGRSSNNSANSDGSQIIARPFVDAATSSEIAEVVSFPGVVAGNVAVRSNSDPMIIADVVLRSTLCDDCARHVDFLIGYRYLHFAESLQIQENLTSLDPLVLGTKFLINDHFATRNDFNGALVGLETEWSLGPWSLQIFGKLAAGNLRREVTINGNTVITTPGAAPLVYPGGLLALPSNSGTFTSDHFVCLPELGVTAGWQITPCIRATLGYSLLWLTDFVRPGDQIDRTVNPNLLPPALPTSPIRPIFTLHDSDFWVQGIRIGLEFRF